MQFAWWLCHPKPSDNIEDVNHETALMLLQIKAGTETFGTAPCGSGPKAEGVSPERKSMNTVAVVTNTNKPLMPTSPYRARKLLSSGKAKIVKHRPFSLQSCLSAVPMVMFRRLNIRVIRDICMSESRYAPKSGNSFGNREICCLMKGKNTMTDANIVVPEETEKDIERQDLTIESVRFERQRRISMYGCHRHLIIR